MIKKNIHAKLTKSTNSYKKKREKKNVEMDIIYFGEFSKKNCLIFIHQL